eukprot:9503467-Pyramimonas_sp.AAC.1
MVASNPDGHAKGWFKTSGRDGIDNLLDRTVKISQGSEVKSRCRADASLSNLAKTSASILVSHLARLVTRASALSTSYFLSPLTTPLSLSPLLLTPHSSLLLLLLLLCRRLPPSLQPFPFPLSHSLSPPLSCRPPPFSSLLPPPSASSVPTQMNALGGNKSHIMNA